MLKKIARLIINTAFLFPSKGTVKRRNLFGYQVYLLLHDFSIKKALLGLYERQETKFLAGFVTKEDICLNIGANFGYYTYLLASRSKSVVAIEPIPAMQELISKTIGYNKIENIQLIRSACGAENGQIKFLESETTGLSSASYGDAKAAREYEVNVLKADDLRLAKLDVVVIDVEGFELEVLKGLKQTLYTVRPRLLMIELYDPYLKRFGSSLDGVIGFLKQLSYIPMELVHGRLNPWKGGKVLNDNFFFMQAKRPNTESTASI